MVRGLKSRGDIVKGRITRRRKYGSRPNSNKHIQQFMYMCVTNWERPASDLGKGRPRRPVRPTTAY